MTEQRLFSNQRLIRLIIPLVIEQALTILVGMCDGVMVSSVGEAAISGVSLVDMINQLINRVQSLLQGFILPKTFPHSQHVLFNIVVP